MSVVDVVPSGPLSSFQMKSSIGILTFTPDADGNIHISKPDGSASIFLPQSAGQKGDPGIQGIPGTNGTNGTNGTPGLKGDPGTSLSLLNQSFSVPVLVVGVTTMPTQNYSVPGAVVGNQAVVNARDTSAVSALLAARVSATDTVTVYLPVLVALGASTVKTIDIHVSA